MPVKSVIKSETVQTWPPMATKLCLCFIKVTSRETCWKMKPNTQCNTYIFKNACMQWSPSWRRLELAKGLKHESISACEGMQICALRSCMFFILFLIRNTSQLATFIQKITLLPREQRVHTCHVKAPDMLTRCECVAGSTLCISCSLNMHCEEVQCIMGTVCCTMLWTNETQVRKYEASSCNCTNVFTQF